jgi:hypothetical protein
MAHFFAELGNVAFTLRSDWTGARAALRHRRRRRGKCENDCDRHAGKYGAHDETPMLAPIAILNMCRAIRESRPSKLDQRNFNYWAKDM